MNRRDFLKNSAALIAVQSIPAAATAAVMTGKTAVKDNEKTASKYLVDSEPMLQNYAEDSIGIAFSVTANANGYVIYGLQPDLSDGRKVYCGGFRVTDMNSEVMQVRLTGLSSSTTYYYKVGADRINYADAYHMKITGNHELPRIYSFRTAGVGAESHFCVINDTHTHWDAMAKLTAMIRSVAPSCVVWNGDTCDTSETIEAQKRTFLKPDMPLKDYAATVPYLLVPGNHDSRGLANRHLERVWMYRQPEERASRDWDLGRNFAVRMGDIAMIGLDTAEDKQDENPIFANLFSSAEYRKAQVAWLADALQKPEIASAPYLVAFCHIPIFDDNPKSNPGDITPDDRDERYPESFAMWQRTCSRLWSPLLESAGCQVVITAHQHAYRYDAPAKGRCWAQIVGGGPEGTNASARDAATLMDCDIHEGKLRIRVYNAVNGTLIGEHKFTARQ